jgi:hypothetical protein
MVFRWIGSTEEVPRCRLVALSELEGLLPSSAPRLTPAAR